MRELREDCYGTKKRFEYAKEVINRLDARKVLDMGCGTGANLTVPLAESFPGIEFVGIDNDEESIRFASETSVLPNLRFELASSGPYDVVVASEVLEHVEDPVGFLRHVRQELRSESAGVLITVPNGYGPFELAAAAERVIERSGLSNSARRIRARLRFVARPLRGRSSPASTTSFAELNTLSSSPHINFFTRRDIERMAGAAAMVVEETRARSVLCGYGLHRLVRGRAIEWNVRVAEKCPAISSGWMFLLRPTAAAPQEGQYRPSRYARWKRRLAEPHTKVAQAGGD